MPEDLFYDGTTLEWKPRIKYKATSGMPGFQQASRTCVRDKGPVPEGLYVLRLTVDKTPAKADGSTLPDGSSACRLEPSWSLQSIPRNAAAGGCERYWANWGWNRIRIEAADSATRAACGSTRGGFYLHDSTKGFSHGCIEVEGRFFLDLRSHVSAISAGNVRKRATLTLRVKYAGATTYGGTRSP